MSKPPVTLGDLPDEVLTAASSAYNAALSPRDTTYDPADAMYEAVVAAINAWETFWQLPQPRPHEWPKWRGL